MTITEDVAPAAADGLDPAWPAVERPPSRPAGRATLVLYTATTFLGAALLFLVEPMVTKMLLPMLGGSAAVWNTATVFFQAALLCGYAFAHLSLRRFGTRRQPWVQAGALLVPFLFLPIAVPGGWHPPSGVAPGTWTLFVLTVMVGAPFLVLSTVSPTLQRWFSATSHPHAADPYFLYAAGNVGSLLALLGYPLLIEPALSLAEQARLWAVLYGAFFLLSIGCSIALARNRKAEPVATTTVLAAVAEADGAVSTIDHRTRLRWIAFAAVPSALMLGVTRHIASDVASMPLLWVLPLSLYLVTFIVAFGRKPAGPVRVSARLLKLLVVPLALSFFGLVASLWIGLGLNLAVFFCAAMVAHGRLSDERPDASKLTEFYLLLSVGGVVGGILAALVAPVVFTSVLEYPITIVLALFLLPRSTFDAQSKVKADADGEPEPESDVAAEPGPSGVRREVVVTGLVVVVAVVAVVVRSSGTQAALTTSMLIAAIGAAGAFVATRTPRGYASAIGAVIAVGLLVPANATTYQDRTFFGVHRVYVDQAQQNRHVLLNGTTVHGMEYFEGGHAGKPTTYYHPTGPIGQWFEAGAATAGPRDIGVIGLGSGALAWYGRAGDDLTYYEIDQAVVDVARNPKLFTFLDRTEATVSVEMGDGRLRLAADRDARYDAVVVDAFSGDAIPVHLLTDEAVGLYLDRIGPHGSIVFHISNRYFDFSQIVARLANHHGLRAYIDEDAASPAQAAEGKLGSTWVVLARTPADALVAGRPGWVELGPAPDAPLWTDDYSDLLHVFRW